MADLKRLSFNQATVNSWSLEEAVRGCEREGIPFIGVWREKVATGGLSVSARLVRESGVSVSSLCRGGMFPAATPSERKKRIEENFRAIDEAAALGADVLVLVCGSMEGHDLEGSLQMIAEGIGAVEAYAKQCAVKLGIEPLHPMLVDRSAVVTLKQARELALRFQPEVVGVVIDAFHVWYDPDLYQEIEKTRGRILGFHVSDWTVPLPDVLLSRTMMGDGVIELARIRKAVDAAGYSGPIEVEIFNQEIWNRPGNQVLQTTKERFENCV